MHDEDWPEAIPVPPPFPADEGQEWPPEGYIVVPGAQGGTFDDFSAEQSAPLTTRDSWKTALDGVFVHPDSPLPEGAIPVAWEKEWMVEGRWYGVVITDGVETWWEKVDGLWRRVEEDS